MGLSCGNMIKIRRWMVMMMKKTIMMILETMIMMMILDRLVPWANKEAAPLLHPCQRLVCLLHLPKIVVIIVIIVIILMIIISKIILREAII